MIHLGDITKIDGAKIPKVDVIIGGSPCQDLSVAGRRAGLDGERSGLFMEQIRLIKEMREYDRANGRPTELVRPRFMVWENVAGAFSSNGGEDFRIVLEETAKVADENAIIPKLDGKQKWTPSGAIMGDGWSIAWRVHDAQFWGVPQRRKRIALVADFGGQSAPEILFERKGLSRNIEESGEQREGVANNTEGSSNQPNCYTLKIRGGREIDSFGHKAGKGPLVQTELSGTLGVSQDQTLITKQEVYGISSYDSNAMKSANPHSGIYKAKTTRTLDNNGGNPSCNQGGMIVLEGNGSRPSHLGDGYKESETMYTLNNVEKHSVAYRKQTHPHSIDEGQNYEVTNVNDALNTSDNTELRTPTLIVDKLKENNTYQKVCGTVDCGIARGTGNQLANQDMFVANQSAVRRLTPLECERLQGFPDGWTDIGDWVDSNGKTHKGDADSPRYKALGNSIALPFWQWMLDRMKPYGVDTLGSLFDGIGGFCLCGQRAGITPVWASEIEEFCIAVTKKRFPEGIDE